MWEEHVENLGGGGNSIEEGSWGMEGSWVEEGAQVNTTQVVA